MQISMAMLRCFGLLKCLVLCTTRVSSNAAPWGTIEHSLANSTRTTCVKETRYAATDALFARVVGVLGPDLNGAASNFFATIPSYQKASSSKPALPEPPADLMNAEQKRPFLGWLGTTLAAHGPHTQQLQRLGLRPYVIPQEIHAMSGGGIGFITGGLYNADMVSEALLWAGGKLEDLHEVLDWGGSTGRSIAMWQAAFPETESHLADPIRKSIKWASHHLPTVTAVPSVAQSVGTPYKNSSLDLVFAISIWSHYNFGSVALPMIKEMFRIVRPGGYLVITTHGWASLYSKITDAPTAKLAVQALKTQGHFYVAAFPGNVDWDPDTKSPDWGMSWVDPHWLYQMVRREWEMKLLLNGRNDCLQDVIVLQRRHL